MSNYNYEFNLNHTIDDSDLGTHDESYLIDFNKHGVTVEDMSFDELCRLQNFLNKYIEKEKEIVAHRLVNQAK